MKKLAITIFLCASVVAMSQQRLPLMPSYLRYTNVPGELERAAKIARLSVTWNADGKAFFYSQDGKRFKFDIASGKAVETTEEAKPEAPTNVRRTGFGRGQQPGQLDSPDSKWAIKYKSRNVLLVDKATNSESPITTDATDANRLDYGSVTWTYNEELSQRSAFWWSTDSSKVAFYRFDESKIPDYFLTTNAGGFTNGLLVEPYPKAGADNALTEVFVYDLATKKLSQIDVRDGKPFTNDALGHYVYGVDWVAPGDLRFLRANRRQNAVEWCTANPETGKVRVIVREENPGGWCDTNPSPRFLSDQKRFFWMSQRNGFRNIYLYDLTGKLLSTVSKNLFEAESILKVDEKRSLIWYTGRGGDNPHKLQLYRTKLDGSGNICLTDRSLNHSFQLSPTGDHFVDTADALDIPPSVRLIDSQGKVVTTLATSDLAEFKQIGGQMAERISFKSADGKYDLYGRLYKPSNFDPAKKYPVLVSVYNGPQSTPYNESYRLQDNLTELGFLRFSVESRGGGNRGREFDNSMYLNLGVVEIDDIAAGVKALATKSYVDNKRVGVYGTSYGGYSSIMCLLRYPDVFQAAVASSSVTDWRHYDTIYTERYMWIPQENKEGYEAGSAITYAKNLKGDLMLYYGTIDDNVHPANTMQLIKVLQRERKSFDVQVTPDAGHSGVNNQRMLEYFIEKLTLRN